MDEVITRILEIEKQCCADVERAEVERAKRLEAHKRLLEEKRILEHARILDGQKTG